MYKLCPVPLKTLLQLERTIDGNLVYKFKRMVCKTNVLEKFQQIIAKYRNKDCLQHGHCTVNSIPSYHPFKVDNSSCFFNSGTVGKTTNYITKTCLYNVDHLKSHFYIVKLGFTGVYFSYFCSKKIDCGYSLEPPRQGGSKEYPQSMFWADIWQISEFLSKKTTFFGGKIFSIFE